jgi:DNA-binding response OmpR family regulator
MREAPTDQDPRRRLMARKHVVYVDDNLDLTRLVEGELQDAGYEITIANDGEEGLETILSVQPDMVILDVMMPLMNGWEVCKYLRGQEQFKDLPILMLTGIGRVVNDMTSPLYGASDHLDKPFEMEDLIARVDTLLAKADL